MGEVQKPDGSCLRSGESHSRNVSAVITITTISNTRSVISRVAPLERLAMSNSVRAWLLAVKLSGRG